jgi:hypothetical protein
MSVISFTDKICLNIEYLKDGTTDRYNYINKYRYIIHQHVCKNFKYDLIEYIREHQYSYSFKTDSNKVIVSFDINTIIASIYIYSYDNIDNDNLLLWSNLCKLLSKEKYFYHRLPYLYLLEGITIRYDIMDLSNVENINDNNHVISYLLNDLIVRDVCTFLH